MVELQVSTLWAESFLFLDRRSPSLAISSKLLGLMLFGYRMEAISIMGREVIQPQGLVGLGRSSIDSCGDEIRQAFEIISNAANYGLLVHCTQGKDRTGLIIALILFLLDVPLKAVTHDYVLSEAELLPEKKERMKEINEIGLTEDFAGTPSDWAEKMLSHIREEYNTVSEYLTRIGIDSNMQATVRSNLIFE
ncbi:MAG: hypothetical protein M4579_000874 [Chaenotheca gracillima]|nr:MAG: hypothetical protein M4579_000874 [Chaenotheca gracillima]